MCHVTKKYNDLIKRTITGFVLGALFWIIFMYLPVWTFSATLLLILLQIIVFEWPKLFNPYRTSFWILLPFYPVLPFILMIWMNHSCYRPLLFILFILVSAYDTGSYLIGMFLGKHHIAPRISPGKTWEGFVGGLFCAIVGLWFALYEFGNHKSLLFLFTFSVIVSSVSLLGDLFESWLKRSTKIKDSGNILPGHGGFLDRFDGIIFTVFLFFIFRDLFLTYFISIQC